MRLVSDEVDDAVKLNKPYNSPHEGYAVILEELDELKTEVWKKHHLRDQDLMAAEAIHVAATAIRFLIDCIDK